MRLDGRRRLQRIGMRNFYSRTHPRWRLYDYMQPGVYFVTTITYQRSPILGVPGRHGIVLTHTGNAAHRACMMVSERFDGVLIDSFVVMPDHIHAIIVLLRTRDRMAGLSHVVGWTKRRTSLEIRAHAAPPAAPIWQRSFHDRIIRNADALDRVRKYLAANPARAWNAINAPPSRRSHRPA
jgi:putative transposase